MATRKAAADNGRDNGGSNGPGNGPGNGADPRKALDWELWIDELGARSGEMKGDVLICHADADGRSYGGRVGYVPLLPLEDLDRRIVDEWGAPALYFVRPRTKGGAFGPVGRLEWSSRVTPRAKASPATPAADTLTEKLVDDLRHRASSPPPAAAAPEPMSQMRDLMGMVKDLAGSLGVRVADAVTTPPAARKSAAEELTESLDAVDKVRERIGAGAPGGSDSAGFLRELKPLVETVLGEFKQGIFAIAGNRDKALDIERERLALIKQKLDHDQAHAPKASE